MGDSRIHPTAILEAPFRSFQGARSPVGIPERPSIIEEDVEIGPWCVIGKGAVLHSRVVIEAFCMVDPNATIGADSLLIYRAMVGGEAVIGKNCVIGGQIGEGCIVGSHSRVFGRLIHKQLDTTEPWDEHELPEPSPRVEDESFVGVGALIIGGVTIGPRAYVCAGAIVTRDIPTDHIAYGCNLIIHANRWPGKLADNPMFGDGTR